MAELDNKQGVFKADLMRTFKQLKESRAESVVAYKKWVQRRYKPPSDYYAFLRRIGYATDSQYIKKLRIIVKKENDKRRYAEGDTLPQRV